MRPLGIVLLCSAACSTTPAITLSATPDPLPGDGETPAAVVAMVTAGGAPAEGTSVHFTTTAGAFREAAGGSPLVADVAAVEGKAQASLIPPRQGFGQLRITASASVDGQTPSATATIALVPAGGLAASLSFSCAAQNIGALVHGRQATIHVLCTATARDAKNRLIPRASVQTLAEAGVLDWVRDDAGVEQLVYSVPPDAPPPLDVDPLDGSGAAQAVCGGPCSQDPFGASCQARGGEPCWTDAAGLTHNPRDGVVTLVAAVPGVRGFDDQGEPFVDSNDNGVRDPGEPFIDVNGNGAYDGPSLKQQDRLIWKVFRIVWSGELSVTATGGSRTSHDAFFSAGSGSVTLHLFDRNFNALAANGPAASDGVVFSGACSGDGTIAGAEAVFEQRAPGILFDARDGSIAAPGLRATWTRNTDYVFWTAFQSPTGARQACAISGAIHRAYDPGAPGFAASGAGSPDPVPTATFPF